MQHKAIFSSDFSLSLSSSPKPELLKNANSIGVVDLFCGAGGMTAGVMMAAHENHCNLEIALAVDSDPTAIETYNENFGFTSKNIIKSDLAQIFGSPGSDLNPTETSYLSEGKSTDILIAGPPCQGHSNLNNSTRRMDPRNELYFSVPRAIEIFKPKVAIIENVPGVIHSKEKVVERTKSFLDSIGYAYKEVVVNFLSLGIPQTRQRHILLASTDENFLHTVLQNKITTTIPSIRNWISNLPTHGNPLLDRKTKASQENHDRISYLFENNIYDLPNELRPKCHSNGNHSYNSVYGRLNPDKPSQTITSGFGSMGQGRYVHPFHRRTITAREAARIQGFPDWFNFDCIQNITTLRQVIANAVPAALTYSITKDYFKFHPSKNN